MSGLLPTPEGITCPECKHEGYLLIGVDYPHYYRVTELTKDKVVAKDTGDRASEGSDMRLFCGYCGNYFQVPDVDVLT